MDMLTCPFDCYKGQSTFPLLAGIVENMKILHFF